MASYGVILDFFQISFVVPSLIHTCKDLTQTNMLIFQTHLGSLAEMLILLETVDFHLVYCYRFWAYI